MCRKVFTIHGRKRNFDIWNTSKYTYQVQKNLLAVFRALDTVAVHFMAYTILKETRANADVASSAAADADSEAYAAAYAVYTADDAVASTAARAAATRAIDATYTVRSTADAAAEPTAP